MLNMVINNTSTIDILKKEKFEKEKTSSDILKEVFGGSFSLKWFIPTKVNYDLTIEHNY